MTQSVTANIVNKAAQQAADAITHELDNLYEAYDLDTRDASALRDRLRSVFVKLVQEAYWEDYTHDVEDELNHIVHDIADARSAQ